MASWIEIDRVRKDKVAQRRIIAKLLASPEGLLDPWQLRFLNDLLGWKQDLSTRQAEELLYIRDSTEHVSVFFGFSVKTLLQKCCEARLDLSEADDEWVVQMRAKNPTTIVRRNVGRLMRCARQLGFVEEAY